MLDLEGLRVRFLCPSSSREVLSVISCESLHVADAFWFEGSSGVHVKLIAIGVEGLGIGNWGLW